MPVPCFTRTERNGMFVIQALAGQMKHDCMIVNETVKFVYDQVVAGMPLEELLTHFRERALARRGTEAAPGELRPVPADAILDEERIRFDLYRTLMAFRDREIGDYAFADVVTLLPPGRVLRGTTQVMPICLLDDTAALVARALTNARLRADSDGGSHVGNGSVNGNGNGPDAAARDAAARDAAADPAEVFYSFPAAEMLNPRYFEPEQLLRRHLDQAEVYFVAVDAAGRLEAVTAVQGLPQQPATLRMFLSAARADGAEAFEQRMGIHLARMCGLVQVTTLSAKIRFQWTTGEEPRATRHPVFDTVTADLGFRRALVLPDEFGEGNALIAYDRTLF